MKILIAGTPGTGKTTLSRLVSRELGYEHIDVSEFIESQRVYESYNSRLDTYEFDLKKVERALRRHLSRKKEFIVETHCADTVRRVAFDHVFVLRVPNDELYVRLRQRKYSEEKIRENIECEIFGEVFGDCVDVFGESLVTSVDNGGEKEPGSILRSLATVLDKIARCCSF